MKKPGVARALALSIVIALLAAAAPAGAVMVSYTATLSTSKGNPVTNLLILESNGVHPVQATVYPSDVPGHGTTVISHDAPYQPTTSLLIGLTAGVDVDGSDKTQIVMFLDPAFAAAHAGVPYRMAVVGAPRSEYALTCASTGAIPRSAVPRSIVRSIFCARCA